SIRLRHPQSVSVQERARTIYSFPFTFEYDAGQLPKPCPPIERAARPVLRYPWEIANLPERGTDCLLQFRDAGLRLLGAGHPIVRELSVQFSDADRVREFRFEFA